MDIGEWKRRIWLFSFCGFLADLGGLGRVGLVCWVWAGEFWGLKFWVMGGSGDKPLCVFV